MSAPASASGPSNGSSEPPRRNSSPNDDATLNQINPLQGANEKGVASLDSQKRPGGSDFWLVIVSLMVATFVSALDVTAVSTALPTIVSKLQGREFVWVGSSYTLASTAFLPMSGGLAQIWGRKPVILGALLLFLLGSGICGGAHSMGMLIAGRTIQGLGSGGILALTEIIIADLVPLRQRGAFLGIFGGVWAVAAAVGPPIGGAFSESTWRWLFYLNVPLTAVATVLVFVFLHVKSPRADFRTRMGRIDWIGNTLVIAATTSTIIALTWGGVRYPWDSYKVLVPLILGIVGLIAFFIYEGFVPSEPVVPWELLKHRTSLSGYLGTFFQGIVVAAVCYFVPVYFQAAKTQSALRSGVSFLATACTISAGSLLAGPSVSIVHRYRPQNVIGWILIAVGLGFLTLLRANSSPSTWIGVQVPIGLGIGVLFPSVTFPILAPLPLSESAHALALLAFFRNFSLTWGTTIGSTILQNELKRKLPSEFLEQVTGGADSSNLELAYAVIPVIPTLSEPLKTQVRVAFAESLRLIWFVLLGVAGAGVLSLLLMREQEMADMTDDQWGMKEQKRPTDSGPA